jgi:hypothetical protein
VLVLVRALDHHPAGHDSVAELVELLGLLAHGGVDGLGQFDVAGGDLQR